MRSSSCSSAAALSSANRINETGTRRAFGRPFFRRRAARPFARYLLRLPAFFADDFLDAPFLPPLFLEAFLELAFLPPPLLFDDLEAAFFAAPDFFAPARLFAPRLAPPAAAFLAVFCPDFLEAFFAPAFFAPPFFAAAFFAPELRFDADSSSTSTPGPKASRTS